MPRGKTELSIAKLTAFLDAQKAKRQALLKEKKRLLKELKKTEAKLAIIDGSSETRTGRGGNAKTLVEVMVDAMSKSSEGMSIDQIIAAVEATGYISTSDNFRSIVNQALIREKKRFIKLKRGVYTARK